MKKFILLTFISFLCLKVSNGQNFSFPDEVKYSMPDWIRAASRNAEADTLVLVLKRDKAGKIIEYSFEIRSLKYQETYSVKKGWEIGFVSELNASTNTGTTTYVSFDVNGLKTEEHFYEFNGEYLDKLN